MRIEISAEEILEIDRLAGLGSLTGSIAHEVLNPLAAALNFSMVVRQLLAGDDTPPERMGEVRRHLDDVIGEISRVCRVLSTLRTLAHSGATSLEPCDLNRTVAEALELIYHRLKLEGIQLERRLAAGMPCVRCDRSRIQQFILSTVLNGAGRSDNPPGGAILVATGLRRETGEAFVEVQWGGSDFGVVGREAADLIGRVHSGRVERSVEAPGMSSVRLVLPLSE